MKKLLKIILLLTGVYLLLMIPLPQKERELQKASKSAFLWDQDALWNQLERAFLEGRKMPAAVLDSLVLEMTQEMDSLLLANNGDAITPGDVFYPTIENKFFQVAPLIAAQQNRTGWYINFYNQLREKLKEDTVHWDINTPAARQMSYRILYGIRAAVEEIMLQSPEEAFVSTMHVHEEPSAAPQANILGITVHSGDLLVSRGGAEVSAFISRGNDFPGNFSHVALVYVNEETHEPFFVEAHIEKGVAIATKEEYLKDKKLRFMVMRPRADLPELKANPLLPHDAARYMYKESIARHIPYDFKMDYFDSSAMFCSEVGSYAYKQQGIQLWEFTSTISSEGIMDWLHSFGVEHFVTQMPSDLEYDPMLSVVGEWRDRETLFKDHLDNAVMDALIERANAGEKLGYNIWLLPVARVIKAYSFLLTSIGKEGVIPEGMPATVALKNNDFVARFQALKSKTLSKAEDFQKEKGYTPPYWQLVSFAESSLVDK
ncbi:YiiX/YebB-like N1pC/P60 family cysteine hydrolase [Lentiprolixibacter aurantiacus]|uniref:YiiX/YebB-like N1pC/P60 family cysteine hydrolase n=1 Tax=Lentiprolixibacter aurantiacus TaxID=2993939 RepID=A0AAE3MJ96_9FLAO|nr:YiiX/YebB-like N1pC/P60 family cysteine hydrolase [Lentiprolixibacter aurantiacus]MCX2718453.1 YiiX/YebB-like N1pC/P60 family cysteine hydrolase [Lentiprolixibacter aurantiacus]